MGVGDFIRKNRTARGLTLQQLANIAGISKPYLSQLENSKFQPSATTLKKLSIAFDMPYAEMLKRSEHKDLYIPLDSDSEPDLYAHHIFQTEKLFDPNTLIQHKGKMLSASDKEKLLKFLEVFILEEQK